MKQVGAANGSIRKTIAAKDGAETAASAEKLAGLCAHVTSVGRHGKSGRLGQSFGRSQIAWRRPDQGCHTAHREKLADGTYQMK